MPLRLKPPVKCSHPIIMTPPPLKKIPAPISIMNLNKFGTFNDQERCTRIFNYIYAEVLAFPVKRAPLSVLKV